MEIINFTFNALLLSLYLCRVLAVLCNGKVTHVHGLVYLSIVATFLEIIVERHCRNIVAAACHHFLLCQIWCNIIIVEPEQRVFGNLGTELTGTVQYGANGCYAFSICTSALVIKVALLDKIAQYLGAWNIALSNGNCIVLLLVVYAVVVEELLWSNNILFCE